MGKRSTEALGPQGEWSATPAKHPEHDRQVTRAQESGQADWAPTEAQLQEAIDKGDAEKVLAEWLGDDSEEAVT